MRLPVSTALMPGVGLNARSSMAVSFAHFFLFVPKGRTSA